MYGPYSFTVKLSNGQTLNVTIVDDNHRAAVQQLHRKIDGEPTVMGWGSQDTSRI